MVGSATSTDEMSPPTQAIVTDSRRGRAHDENVQLHPCCSVCNTGNAARGPDKTEGLAAREVLPSLCISSKIIVMM